MQTEHSSQYKNKLRRITR